jgi:D-alanyl-D-alanine carboxypeptidase
MHQNRAGRTRPIVGVLIGAVSLALVAALPAGAATPKPAAADAALDKALDKIVTQKGGPPGIAVVVQRGADPALHSAGTSLLGSTTPIQLDDHVRVASVAKAFSGATELSVVASGELTLASTIGEKLPTLPKAWADVTLGQLLQHTSGIPDFSQSKAFGAALTASLQTPPPHAELLSYVANDPLLFTPGSKYQYSNSDNIAAALMVEAVTGHTFEDEFATRVLTPLGLTATSLPNDSAMPAPFAHAYDITDPAATPEDVTSVFAAGWTWASGGVVSSPRDANAFVRGYVSGKTTNAATQQSQFTFRKGSSEPPGPGKNSAGMAVFRYQTPCGTVYGHTGNTAGFTQFIAATKDGSRSVSVSINGQIIPKSNPTRFRELRAIYGLAVCAAMA